MPISAPTDLRFEHRTDDGPVLGLGVAAPRLTWIVTDAPAGYAQDGYEIAITGRDRADETAKIDGSQQVLVEWPFAELRSRETLEVRIRVHSDSEWSPWSEAAVVEAGLLRPEDWSARFISTTELAGIGAPVPVLSGTLDLSGVPDPIVKARLYSSAHGVYTATINGVRVGEDHLAPGWTSYPNRLRYQTYDVTELVSGGLNQLDVLLGNGWYRGRLGWGGQRALYGDRLAALAQLEVTLADGSVHTLASDPAWTARESAIVADDLYDGQRTDLRRTPAEALTSGVEIVDADFSQLFAPHGPGVRVVATLPALSIESSPSGATLVDFGQNLVGWVRLRVRGLEAGAEVTIRHAEVLEDGELGVRPLRTAKAIDTYLLDGELEQVLEPAFTFHGFRYAEISGVPDLSVEDLEAVVLSSDLTRTGWFTSSDPMLNRLHENVIWGMRGNFVDVPTDCPQRDERLGWTGDIQVFSPSAGFLFDSAGFLGSWLADLAAEQDEAGGVPFVVPDVLGSSFGAPAAAAWGDAATIVPWVLYQRFGDAGILATQFDSMRAWVDRMAALAGPDLIWSGGFQFGDWLDPTAPPQAPFDAKADPDVAATACFARCAEVVGLAAEVLGRTEIAQQYTELARAVRAAFAGEFVTGGGRVLSDAATVYAQAIVWGLLPDPEQQRRAGDRLADLVRTSGFRISTGFIGTPLITDALTRTGHADVAYRLLLQKGCPSWLYAVTMGATTIWERWDSMLPDGSINPGQMTSFNHYALGAVADWLHRTVAGLAPAAPGYREIVVRPVLGRGLTSASARHRTPYGIAEAGWERQGAEVSIAVTVPVGSTATVHLPGRADPIRVAHGTHTWSVTIEDDENSGISTVRDLMDHETVWAQVVALAQQLGAVTDEAEAAGRLRPYLDAGPAAIADALVPEHLHLGEAVDQLRSGVLNLVTSTQPALPL
jgi:alpha-L-rhamnosidase